MEKLKTALWSEAAPHGKHGENIRGLKDVLCGSLFARAARDKYSGIIQALYEHLPAIASGLQKIKLVHISDDVAEHRISRFERIVAKPKNNIFYLFQKERRRSVAPGMSLVKPALAALLRQICDYAEDHHI